MLNGPLPKRPPLTRGQEAFSTTISHKEFFMAAAYLPSVLVPLVGLVFPAIAMASLFLYIEKEEIA
ncbi:probable photosystem I reaction center subunit VIII at C-terminar half (chloroplast) [Coccomyxa sp. Obi]|nr:probable photosystem I reaction center subunit VIII at C-terminar half [Coccomyxa sp. Obi]